MENIKVIDILKKLLYEEIGKLEVELRNMTEDYNNVKYKYWKAISSDYDLPILQNMTKQEIRDRSVILKNKYEEYKEKAIEKIIKFRKVNTALKHNYYISKKDLETVFEFLEEVGKNKLVIGMNEKSVVIDEAMVAKIIEEVNMNNLLNYNQLINGGNNIDIENMYYEKFEPVQVSPSKEEYIKNNALALLKLWKDFFKSRNAGEFFKYLPKNGGIAYSKTEFRALYHEFMTLVENEIFENYKKMQSISDKEEIKNIKFYIRFLNGLYLKARDHFELELISEQIEKLNLESDLEENKLIFSVRSNGSSYFLKDLEKVPEESYEAVKQLLEGKINRLFDNDPEKDTSLTGNYKFKGLRELRDDQVRIVYRHIRDNIYCMVGVELKKDDNDLPFYNKCADRPYLTEYNEEEQAALFNEIMDYIEKNKRKRQR